MHSIEHLPGGIVQVRLASAWSRAVGYSVCAFLARGVLVDTGFPGARREVARLLDELRPAGVVVTHAHEDHAGNVELAAARGLPVAAGEATLAAVRAGEAHVGLYRKVLWGGAARLERTVVPFAPGGLELLHTPGHSPDHHVVWDAEREVLFAGDLFLGVRVRAARPFEDPRALAASLRRVAALRPRVLLCGHRGLVPDPARALEAKASWIEETVGRIDALAARGWSDRAIARAVLGREDHIAALTAGDLSRLHFVRATRRGAPVDAA